MDSRRLPSVVFVVALLFGVLAKVWRAGDLYLETDALDGFRWLPFGVGSELLVAAVGALIVAAVLRLNFWIGGVVMGLAFGSELFWLALNDVSFRISQVGISYTRLRGDEGVKIKDFHLMAMGDVYPAIYYAIVAIVVAAVFGAVSYRRSVVVPARILAAIAVVGAVVWGTDLAKFSKENFGMGESPVLLLARTYFAAFFPKDGAVLPAGTVIPKTKEERLAMLKPQEPQPPTTAPTKNSTSVQNGILWFSEGIARKQTSLELLAPGGGGEDTTPNLMKALKEEGGLDFENYYTTYHKSIAAIYSMTCSDFPPPDARNIMEINPRIDCGALPEVLSKNHVHVGLFHGGDFGFYDKLQLLGARGFEVQKDARAIAGDNVWEYSWGVDDRAMVDTVLKWVDSLPKGDRFFAVIIPITAHYPYQIPPDVKPAFPGSSAKNRFYSAVHFLDEAFGRLEEGLKSRQLNDDTAVLFMADHGETVAERPRASAGRRLAYEPSLHIPLVIFAPKMFTSWQKSQRVGSHVDLVPTILDLMGLPQDPRNHGRSLVADDFEARRVFVGANNGPKYLGFVDGRQKFVVNRSSGLAELYDLDKDPFEQNNLADEQPEKVVRLTGEALAFADGQLAHLKTAPKVPGDTDTQLGLVKTAKVTAHHKDGTVVECARDPADVDADKAPVGAADADLTKLPWRRPCAGEKTPVFLGQKLMRLGGMRTCVLVNVPDGGGSVEIELGKQEWLPFLTRIRAIADSAALDEDDVALLTAFGDGKQGQEKHVGFKGGQVRVTYPSSTDKLVIRLSGDHALKSPVCLTFNEKAWRGSTPDADAPTDAPPAQDDDIHGAVPKPAD